MSILRHPSPVVGHRSPVLRHFHHSNIPQYALTDGDSGTVMTGPVLAGRQQHVLGFVLGDTMPAQVREAGIRVPEEPQSHL